MFAESESDGITGYVCASANPKMVATKTGCGKVLSVQEHRTLLNNQQALARAASDSHLPPVIGFSPMVVAPAQMPEPEENTYWTR